MRNALGLSHTLDYEVAKPEKNKKHYYNYWFFFLTQYLHPSSRDVPVSKDTKEYRKLEDSMDCIGFSGQEKADIFKVVAAVLHLGNIKFEDETTNRKGIQVVQIQCNIEIVQF